MSVKKIRPIAEVKLSNGIDGRDAHYYIAYSCPVCHRTIYGYGSSNACDRCGTFYDWGSHAPKIQVIREIEWDK